MKWFSTLLLLALCTLARGQSSSVAGEALDENAHPLQAAAAVLLDPADSTLLYFSITGSNGRFEMNNVKAGDYVLQISLLGYRTYYKKLSVPLPAGEPGQIVMVPKVFGIEEVTVTGERIPMRIKQDTIEYDAKAYKVKPDAVAEDLIRKLPGVEVDRAGNIKALGEDVENLLVDGKEFFGNDPKVATRNLPADAIDKVQLFDRPTDESRFTGIDDGERNPTLNLVLDKDKKKGIFGDVLGGAGTDERLQGSAKVYKFTTKSQFAALGMYNNINQPGFSMSDFINFSGGMSSITSGGGHFVLGGENSFPVNFGQPVYGTGSNGAAGLNYSISNQENDRFFISWLGNGSGRKLSEISTARNYLQDGSFLTDSKKDEVKKDTANRVNLGIRKVIGTRQNIIANGGLSYNTAESPLNSLTSSYMNGIMINDQDRNSLQNSSGLSVNGDAAYLLKINEGKTIFRLSGRASYTDNSSGTRFTSMTYFPEAAFTESLSQFYDLDTRINNYSGGISLTQKITSRSFMDIALNAGLTSDDLKRRQGDMDNGMQPDPDLSPDFTRADKYLKPTLRWKLSTPKTNLTLSMGASLGKYESVLNDDAGVEGRYRYLNPAAQWEFNYRSGRRLMLDYMTNVITPRAAQLMPVVNNLNSLSLFYGNRDLKPEYQHTARLSWWLFDQFSFTTLLASLNMRYTLNSIGYSRNVNEGLQQIITLKNMKDGINAGGMVDFSTAVRPLGMKVNLVFDESWGRGISYINDAENVSNNLTHRMSLTLSNRKKEKWDIETGTAITFRTARYSIQESLNDKYRDISWFSEVRYTPGKRISMMGSADITKYSSAAFNEQRLIPLVNAEVSCYVLKNQRGVFTLAGIDLLNRNTGIERMSELNTLTERRSSILGRYLLLSFKYRLNKLGDNSGGIDIQVKRR